MGSNQKDGDVCVSANTGAVGEVKNGKCHITMAEEIEKFYTSAQRGGSSTTSGCPNEDCPRCDRCFGLREKGPAAFRAQYPTIAPNSGESRTETEFHTLTALSSSCDSNFEWTATCSLQANLSEIGW